MEHYKDIKNMNKEQMMNVGTYLYFMHDAKNAIETYESVFGAEVVRKHF